MRRKVLFVTYGGGHAKMVIPVVRALQGDKNVACEILALTLAGPMMESEGLAYKGYKDFVTPADKEALAWGKRLAAANHLAETGIAEEESVAYLGLSYWDLIARHGEAEAARLWEAKGRHAFLQLSVLKRIISALKPDMVVTTNSPRSEQAAVMVARQHGIPTLSMADLFGIYHFYPMESDFITVLCERVIDILLSEGVNRPRDAFLVTGNPSFDAIFDNRGPVDLTWRHQHFPHAPEDAKALLWIDVPGYMSPDTRDVYIRSKAEIEHDLDTLAQAVRANNGVMLIRPHPSQGRAPYDAWMKRTAHPHVFFAGGLPLYPLLKSIDVVATFASTVSVEALLMQRRVIQLKYHLGRSDIPVGEWKLAWQADTPEALAQRIGEAFRDDEEFRRMQERVAALLPQEKAAPKIAAHIRRVVQS